MNRGRLTKDLIPVSLKIADNKNVFKKSEGLESIYGSSYYVNKFNLDFNIYEKDINVDSLITDEIVNDIE